ncbi:hypothetical protein HMPREF1982_01012 [Clostridiales bacterium oral taxon 876 str. F0540]|nr:hypothetical protein HMPREF1982_01012 [Clostridiales bacterium oral taxon 876 str. F0540]
MWKYRKGSFGILTKSYSTNIHVISWQLDSICIPQQHSFHFLCIKNMPLFKQKEVFDKLLVDFNEVCNVEIKKLNTG